MITNEQLADIGRWGAYRELSHTGLDKLKEAKEKLELMIKGSLGTAEGAAIVRELVDEAEQLHVEQLRVHALIGRVTEEEATC